MREGNRRSVPMALESIMEAQSFEFPDPNSQVSQSHSEEEGPGEISHSSLQESQSTCVSIEEEASAALRQNSVFLSSGATIPESPFEIIEPQDCHHPLPKHPPRSAAEEPPSSGTTSSQPPPAHSETSSHRPVSRTSSGVSTASEVSDTQEGSMLRHPPEGETGKKKKNRKSSVWSRLIGKGSHEQDHDPGIDPHTAEEPLEGAAGPYCVRDYCQRSTSQPLARSYKSENDLLESTSAPAGASTGSAHMKLDIGAANCRDLVEGCEVPQSAPPLRVSRMSSSTSSFVRKVSKKIRGKKDENENTHHHHSTHAPAKKKPPKFEIMDLSAEDVAEKAPCKKYTYVSHLESLGMLSGDSGCLAVRLTDLNNFLSFFRFCVFAIFTH